MPKSSEIEGLLSRLEAATGPDRGLDRAIMVAVFGEGSRDALPLPPYTDSIDAAVGLAEGITHRNGRKLICFFCAGGQLTPDNAVPGDADYHPLAKIDTSVTAGWLAHVSFYKSAGNESYGPDRYSHSSTAPLAILVALFRALSAKATP